MSNLKLECDQCLIQTMCIEMCDKAKVWYENQKVIDPNFNQDQYERRVYEIYHNMGIKEEILYKERLENRNQFKNIKDTGEIKCVSTIEDKLRERIIQKLQKFLKKLRMVLSF